MGPGRVKSGARAIGGAALRRKFVADAFRLCPYGGQIAKADPAPEMSATSPVRPVLPPDIRARKGGAPLVVLTAYSTPVARLVDAHCDIVLVGDSVGMVIHGLPSTLGVTMEMMILHGKRGGPGR